MNPPDESDLVLPDRPDVVAHDTSPGSPEIPEIAETSATMQASAMRASWWTGVQAVIGLPLAFAVNLIVARTLGPHGYGLVASYMAAYALILVVLNGGISDATLQWSAAAYARGQRAELLRICNRCAGYHMLIEAPFGAVAAVVLLSNESWWVQLVAAAAIALTMMLGTTVVMLSAMSRNAQLSKLNLVAGLALQLAVVTAAVQSHDAGPTWAARLAVAVLVPIGALFLAPRDLLRASFTPRLPRNWPAGFAKYSLRTLVGSLVGTLVLSRCELLVLDAYGLTGAAGMFALAAGLASQITAPVDAMLTPLIPAAASLVAVDRARAAGAVLRGVRLSGLITAPIAAVAIPAVAVLAPALYGGRFTETGALFISLGAVSCLQSVLHPSSAFIGALRMPLVLLTVNCVALAVDLGLVIALVPVFGAAGAVAGNCAGQLVVLGAFVWMLRRYLAVPGRLLAHALMPFLVVEAWVVVVSAATVTLQAHGLTRSVALVSGVIIALGGSLLAIRAAGGIVTPNDLDAVATGFPRATGRVVPGLRRIGAVRADVMVGAEP